MKIILGAIMEIFEPAWVSVFIALVLAIITAIYMLETRKMRIEAAKPRFSLRTGLYTIGGGMHELILRNSGGVARNVQINIISPKEQGKKLFSPSVDESQEIRLFHELEDIRNALGIVKIELEYVDAYNKKHKDTLKIDYKQLKEENREITFQSPPIEDLLEDIKKSIENLRR